MSLSGGAFRTAARAEEKQRREAGERKQEKKAGGREQAG